MVLYLRGREVETRLIYCCNCKDEVNARLTDGKEIYPHREDLHSLPFWKCDSCGGKVGCHHKTKNRTAPLGVIPSPRISKIRGLIHCNLDIIWRTGVSPRKKVYSLMSKHLGYEFHSAKIKSDDEADKCLRLAEEINRKFGF